MDIREQVLTKQKEFSNFIQSVDVDALRATYSRVELTEFVKSLQKIPVPSLSFDVSKVIEEMKKEEFPQLTGVHNYPVISEFNLLTQLEKELLDKHLAMIGVGNRVYNLSRVVLDFSKEKSLKTWLLENEIVEAMYMVTCPSCHTGDISREMNEEKKDALLANFRAYKDGSKTGSEEVEKLVNQFEFMCYDCEELVDISRLYQLDFKQNFNLLAERDKSLDNA